MRPLELRLKHFGPYRDEAVLDFTALDRLFLVCGPTGAGKTTLFDALTFALYEKTPGTRGALGDQLVSHHAPEGSVPQVSLRFSLGAQEWRVTRQLKHRVRKQRGEGWKDQDAQVLLEIKSPSGWEPCLGKRSEINEKIESMLGLSAEEFAKIVVLPQGDFQRFLEASSGDREAMLKKLFPVESYERLVEALKLRAKVVEDERTRWENRWEELQSRLGSTAIERQDLEAQALQATQAAQQAARAESAAAEDLLRCRNHWSDWALLTGKRAEEKTLKARSPQMEQDRQRMEAARLVRPLGADLDRQQAILTEGLSLRASQERCRAELVKSTQTVAILASEAAQQRTRERRLETVIGELRLADHQAQLWKEAQALSQRKNEAQLAEQKAREFHLSREKALEVTKQRAPLRPEGPDWDQALVEIEQARERHQQAARRAELVKLIQIGLEEVATASKAAEAAEGEFQLWSDLVRALRAADFAQELSEGSPCPVCGSRSHPLPATWPEASAQAPVRLKDAETQRDEARRLLAQANARLQGLQQQLSELPLAEFGEADVDAAAQALRAATVHLEALQEWTRKQKKWEQELATALQEEQAAREVRKTSVAATELIAAQQGSLAEAAPEDPTPHKQALTAEEQQLRRDLEAQAQRTLAMDRRQRELQTQIDELEKQLAGQRDEFSRLKLVLDGQLAGLGLTLEKAREVRLPEDRLQPLELTIATFDREIHRLEGELAALEAKFPNGPPAPWEPLAEILAAKQRERSEADALAKEREFLLRDRDRIESELREVMGQKTAIEAEFQRIVPLTRALDGYNDSNLKLTTWVLVQALEQVARSATQRLASMSGGRYALKVQTLGNDARKGWGLDLSVIDSYTGQERGVGTLSGGEKFMTSISLALGLADVIQERSGGLKLEAVFIDEGFGTLDDQSLDRAMAILHDLGQHRSVGLISHVAELKQRISSRVEVVKGKNGSHLKVG